MRWSSPILLLKATFVPHCFSSPWPTNIGKIQLSFHTGKLFPKTPAYIFDVKLPLLLGSACNCVSFGIVSLLNKHKQNSSYAEEPDLPHFNTSLPALMGLFARKM